MYRKVDAEALFGTIDEFLAKGGADVGGREDLSVTQDRRNGENAQRFPPGFDTHNRLAGLERLENGLSAPRNVIAENLRGVNAVKHERRRCLERDERDALRTQRLHRGVEQRGQGVTIAFDDSIAYRRQCADYRADRECGATLIVDRGDHAVILQLQLLCEREPG